MKLDIHQDQRQIISPALIQTLELVMLPATELKEKLEEEAKENPAIHLENRKPEVKKPVNRVKKNDFDNKAFMENLSVYDYSLYKYMMEQVNGMDFNDKERRIAQIILSSINDSGFLQSPDDKGVMQQLPPEKLIDGTDVTLKEYEDMRLRILKLEPIGVGSYNLQEYLIVQTEEKFGKKSLEYRILNECKGFLEKKLFTKIASEINVNFADVEKAIENIRKMNVAPASQFATGYPQYVIPDAYVSVDSHGIKITLNDEYIPDVRLNRHTLELYNKQVYRGKKAVLDKEEKLFLKENIDRAKVLIENLKSRKEIIFKVILKIVEKQREYFLHGIQHQIPLKLKDIADELNIHESTVSRVVRDKYIQTGKGIINLKSFFSANVGNDTASSKSLKDALKNFVDAEDKNNALSDDKIVQIFKKKGISISRRTVAKYRAELNIPPAYMRRNPI
jgi:RNA polymerase sigma-54 factor